MSDSFKTVGFHPHDWHDRDSEVAGRHILFRDEEGTVVLHCKFHLCAKLVGEDLYQLWVPLPANKQELARCLREIAEYEGIEL